MRSWKTRIVMSALYDPMREFKSGHVPPKQMTQSEIRQLETKVSNYLSSSVNREMLSLR